MAELAMLAAVVEAVVDNEGNYSFVKYASRRQRVVYEFLLATLTYKSLHRRNCQTVSDADRRFRSPAALSCVCRSTDQDSAG